MEARNRSQSNHRSTSIGSNSPKRSATRSPTKKRWVGKESNGWFPTMTKRLFFGLIIAILAWLFSQYWPSTLSYRNLRSQKSTIKSDQSHSPSESQSETKTINLPPGYTPSCPIKGKESISAINRAVSDTCKKQIAELACRSVDASDGIGNLYPTHLPNFCPTARYQNDDLAGQYIGR